ncbi:MAG: hypothetical protein ACK5MV_08260 [Aminipila sp.]
MTTTLKEQNLNILKEQEVSEENISTYNLCAINGCSETAFKEIKPVVIGCYH